MFVVGIEVNYTDYKKLVNSLSKLNNVNKSLVNIL